MKRVLLSLFILLCFAAAVFAIPAKRVAVTLTQPDGTTINAYLQGDENLHFYVNKKGEMLKEGTDGFFRVATKKEAKEAKERWQQKLTKRNKARLQRIETKKDRQETRSRKAFGRSTHFSGKKKGLVILVNFLNLKMKTEDASDVFNRQFNEVGYSENKHIGSVHDYFFDQSYGTFDLSFDVIGPVTVSREYSYYGSNDEYGDDKYVATMVIEACKLADEYVNFADYDWDGDGLVDQVYLIYAGYGEHAGAARSTIWPHEFELDQAKEYGDGEGAIKLDGVTINTYAVSCELCGISGRKVEPIGTACHEFSHCLGLPDIYDISYEGGKSMGAWDLMDTGSYNGPDRNGEVPCGFTAYEKYFAGWLNLTELSEPCTVKGMPSLTDYPTAYVIYNDGNRDEFFVLENRQGTRWYEYNESDKGIHGMLVTHVDYDATAWEENSVNAEAKHQRMSYIPASKKYSSKYGTLFPGDYMVTELNDESHSSYGGKLFNPNTDGSNMMHKPISEIEESEDGLISFNFMGGGKNVNSVVEVMDNCESEEEYFTMNGARIEKPVGKGIFILKGNGSTKKIIIR